MLQIQFHTQIQRQNVVTAYNKQGITINTNQFQRSKNTPRNNSKVTRLGRTKF